jgi:hypothetical protein
MSQVISSLHSSLISSLTFAGVGFPQRQLEFLEGRLAILGGDAPTQLLVALLLLVLAALVALRHPPALP